MPVKQVIQRKGGVPVKVFTDDVDRKAVEQLAGHGAAADRAGATSRRCRTCTSGSGPRSGR